MEEDHLLSSVPAGCSVRWRATRPSPISRVPTRAVLVEQQHRLVLRAEACLQARGSSSRLAGLTGGGTLRHHERQGRWQALLHDTRPLSGAVVNLTRMSSDAAREPYPEVEPPTWSYFRDGFASPVRSPAWRRVGVWAVDRLSKRLGDEWPRWTWEKNGQLPGGMVWAIGHPAAYFELIELALWLEVLCDRTAYLLPTSSRRCDRTFFGVPPV
jgi:hypothetical protein